jgi:UDP-N-acetylmuramoyl-tripeptide--D-alanyl-D-alanine ligase
MNVHLARPSRVSGYLSASGAELAAITNAELLVDGAQPVRGAVVDSRLLAERPGALFLALPGAATDGRLFLSAAIEAGAHALIVETGNESDAVTREINAAQVRAVERGISLLRVGDGPRALAQLAAHWRSRFDVEVIGVTGSVGKTTTKEAIRVALGGTAAHVGATPGNANNEIGLPLALLNMTDGTTRFVAEMGMYVGGEIRSLCNLAKPRIGVVTAIDAVHAERAGDLDAIEAAKGELVEALPAEGTALLAADDPRVLRLRERTKAQVVLVGSSEGSDIRIISAELDQENARTIVVLAVAGAKVSVNLPLFGVHFARAAAFAVGVAQVCGVDLKLAAERLTELTLPGGRSSVQSVGGVRIIDDSYNAAPSSMTAALQTLCAMGELGTYATDAHLAIGKTAAASGLSALLVFGSEADGIAEGARGAGMPVDQIVRLSADTSGISAGAGLIADRVRAGDTVLIKASRSVALDRLVAALRDRLEGGAT